MYRSVGNSSGVAGVLNKRPRGFVVRRDRLVIDSKKGRATEEMSIPAGVDAGDFTALVMSTYETRRHIISPVRIADSLNYATRHDLAMVTKNQEDCVFLWSTANSGWPLRIAPP